MRLVVTDRDRITRRGPTDVLLAKGDRLSGWKAWPISFDRDRDYVPVEGERSSTRAHTRV